MTDRLSIALAQTNPTVGNIDANTDRIRAARAEAAARGADLVVFPELSVSGYPPEDLVLKPFFLDRVEAAVRALAGETVDGGPALLVGAPWREEGRLYNAVLLLDRGVIAATRFKVDLSGSGVFDETRLFAAGPPPGPVNLRGVRLGIPVCEDIRTPDVVETLAESGAELIVVPNGSSFETGKQDERIQIAVHRVIESGLPLLYVNQVGGQDELIFDGGSFALAADGALVAQAPSFAEHLLVTRWERGADESWACREAETIAPAEGLEAVYAALVLGVRDHVNKNHVPGVLIGLSGGLDSALTAAVAVDALGAERVHAVTMPSPHTAKGSLEDAAETAELLGCRLDRIPIAPAVKAFDSMLAPALAGREPGVAAETLQARARDVTLMALSDQFGALVLATGSKSEMLLGRATPCGGYAVLKDVYRTTAGALARWRNAHVPAGARGPAGRVVPERVLAKASAGELGPGQTDRDALPPYELLDDLLEGLVERDLGLADLAGRGHDAELVARVWRMLHAAERKRRQGPPGPRIARRPLNRERRHPITSGFTDLA
ncbi:NAD+ synthase [Azospirillum agricola]|uniref:NAD+ synthase n=1 Tax=Azospirillum agricola TaxID=1720247 RepID=UPI001AE55FD6|nr:NAD+ synthase [Azospirillum agricola]MBP2232820.1 NAD+ synthase [Azospirillum agricola]